MCIFKLAEKGVLLGLECHEMLTMKQHTDVGLFISASWHSPLTPNHTHTQTPTQQMSTFIHLYSVLYPEPQWILLFLLPAPISSTCYPLSQYKPIYGTDITDSLVLLCFPLIRALPIHIHDIQTQSPHDNENCWLPGELNFSLIKPRWSMIYDCHA